jgi:hypothetical protein
MVTAMIAPKRKGYELPLASLTHGDSVSTPTCASGKFAPVYSEAARILAPSPVSLNPNGNIRQNTRYGQDRSGTAIFP